MEASFEGFTEEQKEEYKRCARLVHQAFLRAEPISGGFRLYLNAGRPSTDAPVSQVDGRTDFLLTKQDLQSFARLEMKACPFLTLTPAEKQETLILDMVESPEAQGFLQSHLKSYGYL
ncbi:MAG: hypothetical protein KDK23_10210 [Leptospiraceae bacterium]|nr:hypothetical protein [Leptospiraceae bacterium]